MILLFSISLLMSSLPLLFSLNSIVNHYTDSLANMFSLFLLSNYLILTCPQSKLKSILYLFHACICLVDMNKEKHKTMLTGFTLCSWSLTLSGTLILPRSYTPTLLGLIISFFFLLKPITVRFSSSSCLVSDLSYFPEKPKRYLKNFQKQHHLFYSS